MRFLSSIAAALGLRPATTTRAAPPESRMQLAFVLLERPELPEAAKVVATFRELAPSEPKLVVGPSREAGSVSFSFGASGMFMVGLMPAPVPEGEAEANFAHSLSSVLAQKKLAPHHAHAMVVFRDEQGRSAKDGLVRFTRFLAALSEAAGAVGVYWGDAGATHEAEFFQTVGREEDPDLLLMLWCGFDLALESPERVSVLTLGLPKQLGLMDLRATMPRATVGEGLTRMLDLLGYAVKRGAPVPDGDTVGRDADEKLKVRWEPSPVDPQQQVWRVDFP